MLSEISFRGELGVMAERNLRNLRDPSAVQGQFPKDKCTLQESEVSLMNTVSLREIGELTTQ